MATVVFVHGTGVREPVATETFEKIRQKLLDLQVGLTVARCNWGGDLGTRLHAGGISIPEYAKTRDIDEMGADDAAEAGDEDYLVPLWELLYQDPQYELRFLALQANARDGEELAPHEEVPGAMLLTRVQSLTPSPQADEEPLRDLHGEMEWAGIAGVFTVARDTITLGQPCRDALHRATNLAEARAAVARAIVAEAMVRIGWEEPTPLIWMDAAVRDRVVRRLADVLGAFETERNIASDWLKRQFTGLVKTVGTGMMRRKRGWITDKFYGFPGDIMLYQARGKIVRDSIRAKVAATQEPVVLMGHSLGGIACVDLLIETPLPQAALLITVGSQAPFLYELNALPSLPYNKDAAREERLPAHFPSWVNIYDPRDFLSYIGEKLSGRRIKDICVDNGRAFPDSHSAYWDNAVVWEEIKRRLP
jgi:hypothetical protein